MVATVAGIHLGLDTHANRPAGNAVPDGSIYSCSTHSLVYKSNYAGNSWATWATLGGTGLSDPMTTRGDIIYRDSANTTARLGRGSASTVLTSDGTDIAWQTPGAASGGFYLDTYADPIDGTMGDNFDEASLNARWTRHNTTSGRETYQQGNGSWLRVAMNSATQIQQYSQTAQNGAWEYICSFIAWGGSSAAARMYGMSVVDGSGNGRGVLAYNDGGVYFATIGTNVYTGATAVLLGTGSPAISSAIYTGGGKVWVRLREDGSNNIYGSYSLNGHLWSPEASVSDSTTWTQVRIGRHLGTATTETWDVDKFDRVA